MRPSFEVVVGLEVHVQLRTATKLFCGCAVQFAAPPNSLTCPVCCGMPGALPVLNGRAVELAIRAGLGLHCEIARVTQWDRKHYFYPDLPKGYQISQLDAPLCREGYLEVPDEDGQPSGRRVTIVRAHLEEDAGKSIHQPYGGARSGSAIDLNRAGTPLLEIVTAPDLRGGDETRRFLVELRQLLLMLDVSDCNMQEGSLRVDANVNVHLVHDGRRVETPIVEIKNLNSFRGVQRAIDSEAERIWRRWQADHVERQPGNKQTRGWNDDRGESYVLRDKEEMADYRYFPDPDLPPLAIDPAWVESLRSQLPRAPADWRKELRDQYGLSAYDSSVLVAQGTAALAYFFKALEAGAKPKSVANLLLGDIAKLLNERQWTIADYPVNAADLGRLLALVDAGEVTQALARQWLRDMATQSRTLDAILQANSLKRIDDTELACRCQELIDKNPQAVEAYRKGKEAALGPLIAELRRALPHVDPRAALERLKRILAGAERPNQDS